MMSTFSAASTGRMGLLLSEMEKILERKSLWSGLDSVRFTCLSCQVGMSNGP